jgi:hypothetical protein
MSAVAIVTGVMEGLQLVEALFTAGAQVSQQIQAAQSSGTTLNLTSVVAQVQAAESAVTAAIAADPNKA